MKSLLTVALAKDGEDLQHSQDAGNITWYKDTLTLCVADGVSQSFFPGKWASLLVKHFGRNPYVTAENWQTWLKPIQDTWQTWVQQEVQRLVQSQHHTSIENENALSGGVPAAASFIGLSIRAGKKDTLEVRMVSVGDCCLLIAYEDGYTISYPYTRSDQFNDMPDFLASKPAQNLYPPNIREFNIPYKRNSYPYVLLASDAIAECLLKEKEQGGRTLFKQAKTLFEQDATAFRAFAWEKLRAGTLKNDDVTVLGYGSPTFPAPDFDHYLLPEPEEANEVPDPPVDVAQTGRFEEDPVALTVTPTDDSNQPEEQTSDLNLAETVPAALQAGDLEQPEDQTNDSDQVETDSKNLDDGLGEPDAQTSDSGLVETVPAAPTANDADQPDEQTNDSDQLETDIKTPLGDVLDEPDAQTSDLDPVETIPSSPSTNDSNQTEAQTNDPNQARVVTDAPSTQGSNSLPKKMKHTEQADEKSAQNPVNANIKAVGQWLRQHQSAVIPMIMIALLVIFWPLSPSKISNAKQQSNQKVVAKPQQNTPAPTVQGLRPLSAGTVIFKDKNCKMPMLTLIRADTIPLSDETIERHLYVSKGYKYVRSERDGIMVKKGVNLRHNSDFKDPQSIYASSVDITLPFALDSFSQSGSLPYYKIIVKGFIKAGQ